MRTASITVEQALPGNGPPPQPTAEYQALCSGVRHELAGRKVWHVNSTATGGGVAELLLSLMLRHLQGGISAAWMVVSAQGAFFDITKRLHHQLHGRYGDGPLGEREQALYARVTAEQATRLLSHLRPGDLVVLHDPQTLGLTPVLRKAGLLVAWRCHIGTTRPSAPLDGAWQFLRRYLAGTQSIAFSNLDYVPGWMPAADAVVIMPSIDPLTEKNKELDPPAVARLLAGIGLSVPTPAGATPGLGRPAIVTQEQPLPPSVPVVVQVSRWDPLKDMVGVLHAFAGGVASHSDAHLVLAGPDPADIPDDPEGAAVHAQVVGEYATLSEEVRARVHLVTLSLADRDSNALLVNALQRRADIVVQKSLEEGFGLTVTEAMWKARPIVASRVGGIVKQIESGIHGLLVDPGDLTGFGRAVLDLLHDRQEGRSLGEAAHRRCAESFLVRRELADHLLLYHRLLDGRPMSAHC